MAIMRQKYTTQNTLLIPARLNIRLTPLIQSDLQWLADNEPYATTLTDLIRRLVHDLRVQRMALLITAEKVEKDRRRAARSKRKA